SGGDLAVTPSCASRRRVGLQQDACPHQLPRTVLTRMDQRAEPFALLIAELDDVLFNGNLFRAHDSSPGFPEPSIQRANAKSTTRGTRKQRWKSGNRLACSESGCRIRFTAFATSHISSGNSKDVPSDAMRKIGSRQSDSSMARTILRAAEK